ncbi:hypothetical protein ACRQ5Q_29030 [Bradyrhizobium sp. PMVTL-01]|uniref:hypothetical protein n=1 Tax=Bradyrhizobium sp. PMVTL-01 TaxID=3434999 RepID=UPI003F72A634
MTDAPATNRKPADRLADLRGQIKVLEAEEAKLRAGFIAGEHALEGDEHAVTVETKTNQRIDARRMRAAVEASIWSPYVIETASTYVTVVRKGER